MAQAGFAYEDGGAEAAVLERLPFAVSIFADRPHVRAEIGEDIVGAGLRTGHCGELSVLFASDPIAIGEVVLVDCPQADEATLAALARLDLRIARCDAQLVVATSTDALDNVFACLTRSRAQILVSPTRAERIVALGGMLGRSAGSRLREMSEENRLALLRLTEQIEQVARQLGGMAGAPHSNATSAGASWAGLGEAPLEQTSAISAKESSRVGKAALPDPRLVRSILRQRQLRGRFFDPSLFGDPAWDILLDLTAARAEHARVSVSSLCIASGVPPTTALRWIGQMVDAGLLERQEDVTDRRRAFIALSDSAADAMARYFAELGTAAANLV